jgi:hypothetical protein
VGVILTIRHPLRRFQDVEYGNGKSYRSLVAELMVGLCLQPNIYEYIYVAFPTAGGSLYCKGR